MFNKQKSLMIYHSFHENKYRTKLSVNTDEALRAVSLFADTGHEENQNLFSNPISHAAV